MDTFGCDNFGARRGAEERRVPTAVRKRRATTSQPKSAQPAGEAYLWPAAALLLLSVSQRTRLRRRALHQAQI